MPLQLSRKLSAACIAFLLLIASGAGAVAQSPIDSCKPVLTINATAFVAGAKDTLPDPVGKQRSILPAYIANGFRLRLTDTTYRIEEFRLGFYNEKTGIYYEQKVQGDSLEPAKLTVASREVVLGVSRFFMDAIRVSKHDNCFWVRAITYSTPNRSSNKTPARVSSSPHTH